MYLLSGNTKNPQQSCDQMTLNSGNSPLDIKSVKIGFNGQELSTDVSAGDKIAKVQLSSKKDINSVHLYVTLANGYQYDLGTRSTEHRKNRSTGNFIIREVDQLTGDMCLRFNNENKCASLVGEHPAIKHQLMLLNSASYASVSCSPENVSAKFDLYDRAIEVVGDCQTFSVSGGDPVQNPCEGVGVFSVAIDSSVVFTKCVTKTSNKGPGVYFFN
ncbi:hypothetical protein [Dongshaea marina]|uniref:hypothetical protein n=1 Tax=Dongshaea marina TaxID=2047966 RepID=UPI000D3E5E67|nr:hypothetical protein [Dongshaea marina]